MSMPLDLGAAVDQIQGPLAIQLNESRDRCGGTLHMKLRLQILNEGEDPRLSGEPNFIRAL